MKQEGKSLLTDIFDGSAFLRHAEMVITRLETYLKDSSIRGIHFTEPSVLLAEASKLMTAEQDTVTAFDEERFMAIVDLYIRTGIQVHSPGYMGRQFSGVIPLAGIFDFISSVLNQPSSFYEAAQLPNVAEHIMADELNQFVGFPADSFTMVSTSGGSLANLTALLAARNDKFPDVWAKGMISCTTHGIPAIAAGENTHYSITRAAGMLGIGEEQIVRLPVDAAGRICADRVQAALDKAVHRGLSVFCLVASVGTTSIGAIDPVDELAEIACKNSLWLHVDGAHGAGLLLSDNLRHKLKGIEKADSLTWDAHKMLFVPAPCSLLFYRHKKKAYNAFHQEASYVFDPHADVYSEYDAAGKNFECTKRPAIINLWMLWAVYGRALFAAKIESLCRVCQEAYNLLSIQPDFEIIHRPETNILCFRYKPASNYPFTVPHFQLEIRNRIRKKGVFFISKVDIGQETALRVVFMNHEITLEHFSKLLDEIRTVGQDIIKETDGISLN